MQLWGGATGTVAEVTCQQVVTALMIWNGNLYSQATWHGVEWILNTSSLLIASSFHSKQLHQRRAGSMSEPASIQGWPGFVFIEDMLTWWQNGFTSSQGFYSNHPKGWIPEWCMCRYSNPALQTIYGILWCSHEFPRILGVSAKADLLGFIATFSISNVANANDKWVSFCWMMFCHFA